MQDEYRPTVLERAFALADSGTFVSLSDIRSKLKSEGYSDEQFMGSTQLRRQMTARIAAAKVKPAAAAPR